MLRSGVNCDGVPRRAVHESYATGWDRIFAAKDKDEPVKLRLARIVSGLTGCNLLGLTGGSMQLDLWGGGLRERRLSALQ